MEKTITQYEFGKDAIIIARVSTPKQVLNPESSPQINDLKDYAAHYGFERLQAFGTTESGFLREDEKQGWNLVTDFISKNPTFRTIIITELSRLGRDDEILMHIKNFLIRNRIQLLVKDIKFELFNRFGEVDPGKDIIFALYASMAAAEMRTKQERFKRALRDYRKLGYSIGGKCLFGYKRICDNRLGTKNTYIIEPKEAEEINTIYNWYINGIEGDLTITSIARITFECRARGFSKYLHSKRNVNKCLKEKAYTGYKITNNKKKNPQYWNYRKVSEPKYIWAESYECSYPRIISDSLFNDVQDKLSKQYTHLKITNNHFVDKSSKHVTILSKILTCPCCGGFYVGDYRIDKNYVKHTYRCNKSKGKLLRKCNNTNTISMVMLDSIIWEFIKTKVEYITYNMTIAKSQINIIDIRREIDRLIKDLEQYEEKINIENIIFRTNMKTSNNKEKIKKEYEINIRRIENERKAVEKIISDKKRVLEIVLENDSFKDDLNETIKSNIERIENNKNEMYKYIHLLIKKVVPVFSDKKYTILEVTFLNSLDEVFDFKQESIDGIPKVNGVKHDNMYYICINKKNKNKIKCRLLTDNQIVFSHENNDFKLYDKHYTIDSIFEINLEETESHKFHDLQNSVENLHYNKLKFYDVDAPTQQIAV